jgi:hypothetical protein
MRSSWMLGNATLSTVSGTSWPRMPRYAASAAARARDTHSRTYPHFQGAARRWLRTVTADRPHSAFTLAKQLWWKTTLNEAISPAHRQQIVGALTSDENIASLESILARVGAASSARS